MSDAPNRCIVVGVGLKSESTEEAKESLYELEELVHTAGGEVAGALFQSLDKPNTATLIGKGKVQEVKALVEETDSNLVIIDHRLSGIQARNLAVEINKDRNLPAGDPEVTVLDRSQLILDIFAQRAQTHEGKLQVELAQMLDQLPRMVGAWQGSLSRQGGGGIGTRGPGETALELDRRRINNRVIQVRKKLDEVSKNRAQFRQKRKKRAVTSFALIGYTNSGKSTLLNQLTQAGIYAEDQLFATLDPTTRKVFLPNLGEAVITDTVGFIRKLPTKLIEAFKATLEESSESDVLLYVLDMTSDQIESHMEVIDQLMKDLKWEEKPVIYVYNKSDKANLKHHVKGLRSPRAIISAQTGDGIEELKDLMTEVAGQNHQQVELFFPKTEEHKIYELGRENQIIKQEVSTLGTICVVRLSPTQVKTWTPYLAE